MIVTGLGILIVATVIAVTIIVGKINHPDDNAVVGDEKKETTSFPSTSPTTTSPSPTNWSWVIGLAVVVILIGALFLWAPWDNKNISPAINKADREMMAQGWQKIAVADVGGGYYSFEIPEGLTPGHKVKFQTVSWEMQRLSSGREVDTCRGEWCTNYFFPAGVSIKDTPLYLKTKIPPRDFEWIKILPL